MTINSDEITHPEIGFEYKIDSNGGLRRYDHVIGFPRIEAYENMNLVDSNDTYQINVENNSKIIGEYDYLNEDCGFAEEANGWTLIQLHNLDIDNEGVFNFEDTSFPFVVIVLYAEHSELSVNIIL